MKKVMFTRLLSKIPIIMHMLMGRIIVFLWIILLFSIHPAHAELEKVNIRLDEKKLNAGKIQTFVYEDDTNGNSIRKRVVGVVLLDGPVSTVWEVLEDWDAMGDNVPSLKYNKTIKVLHSDAKQSLKESLIESLLEIAFVKIIYTLHVRFDKQNLRQDWWLVTDREVLDYAKKNISVKESSGILKNIEGFQYIEPYGDGNKTIYYYAPIVEISGPIPGWIENKITKSSLEDYLEAIKAMVSDKAKRK